MTLLPTVVHDPIRKLVASRRGYAEGALGSIDATLGRYLISRDGYYVELGANDGLRQSNTLRLERNLGWRGLLIEPIPHRFFELRRNRARENHFECVACVPFDFKDRWVEIAYADLMTVSTGLTNDLPSVDAHLELAQQFLAAGENSVTFGSRASTLQSVMDSCSAPKEIDFLSLDVEGAELAVLRGIDFDETSFRYILVESRAIEEIATFLEPKGYRMLEQVTHHDFLFGLVWSRGSSESVRLPL